MRRIFFLTLFVLILIPVSVSAQEPITVEVLQVEFWPEYDKPEMLVIYHLELSSDTELPAALSLRIPTAAGDPYVLFVEGAGEPEYDRQVEGEWASITFTANGSNIQLEYYDPVLEFNGDQRSYAYTWPGDYAVNSFQVIVQQPFDAHSFASTPVLGDQVSGANGLSYHQGVIGNFRAGEQPTISVQYQKPSNTLSINNPGTADFVDEAPPDTGSSSNNDWLVILLAVAGVGILGFGIYSYTQSSSSNKRSPTPARKRKRSSGVSKANVFCHQCGTQAHQGDKFCRECGQKLRL